MGKKQRNEKVLSINIDNEEEQKKLIKSAKKECKVEGGITWYVAAFAFALFAFSLKNTLFIIGIIIFAILGAVKSYESYLSQKFIYYKMINKDNKMLSEYKKKLKAYPNTLKALENFKLAKSK